MFRMLTLVLVVLFCAAPAVAQRFVTVCDGGVCRMVEIQQSTASTCSLQAIAKRPTVSLASACGCDCPDCTCAAQQITSKQYVYRSQPVRTFIRQGPIRRLFGGFRCR